MLAELYLVQPAINSIIQRNTVAWWLIYVGKGDIGTIGTIEHGYYKLCLMADADVRNRDNSPQVRTVAINYYSNLGIFVSICMSKK